MQTSFEVYLIFRCRVKNISYASSSARYRHCPYTKLIKVNKVALLNHSKPSCKSFYFSHTFSKF
ncbi:MAG: DUF1922 domain-containing protein [Clostridia bacterium]|nr:DUF1922 domain-containing protein [Clostridia bacterium]